MHHCICQLSKHGRFVFQTYYIQCIACSMKTRRRSIPLKLGNRIGGGCGCGGMLHGGYTYPKTRSRSASSSSRQSGGSGCDGGAVGFGTSFNSVPISTFFPLNSFQHDPNYYSLDSRNIPMSGGSKTRRRLGKTRRTARRCSCGKCLNTIY